MLTIEEFQAEKHGYASIVSVYNAAWERYPITAEEQEYSDKTRNPKYIFKRLVVLVDDRIVAHGGYIEPHFSYEPGKFYIFGSVHPDFRRQGIGTALYQTILEHLAQYDVTKLECETYGKHKDAISFMENRGFQCVLEEYASELDIQAFDIQKFSGLLEKLASRGIRIYTLPELKKHDPEWLAKTYDVMYAVDEDIPNTGEVLREDSLERFEQQYFAGPDRFEDAQIIAVDQSLPDSPYVGVSAVSKAPADPSKLYTLTTGVRREYRRQGIATAMKAIVVEAAKKTDARVILTENEVNNPMYDLNVKLGFKPVSSWLIYQKELA